MSTNTDFVVSRYDFNSKLFNELQYIHYAKDLWPLVYILTDGEIKEAYIGETTDAFARMNSHLKNNAKNKLTSVHLITSEKFNKSATLDIESNLIKYISADGQFKLLNANVGLANHNYYQKKDIYWNVFRSIWDKLRAEGISKYSLEYIDNSDLFKYSPYKSLSIDQKSGLLTIIKSLLSDDCKTIIVEGGAGTGKSILAIYLFKLLKTDNADFNFKEFGEDESDFMQAIIALKLKYPNPNMALVVPMASFRNTLKRVFKNIKGLTAKMVIGPAELAQDQFDIILVDESHRLRRRINLGAYFKAFDDVCKVLNFDKNDCSELDWVLKQSQNAILFYDENQSIKPSDVKKDDFDKLKKNKFTEIQYLKSQFRVKGGTDYVDYIDKLLKSKFDSTQEIYKSKDYEFLLFESIDELVKEIKLRDDEYSLSRLVAGYSWKWISNKDKDAYDINIEDTLLRWNTESSEWVNSKNSANEVGCIHTTQGYDLNYAGIIFGNEITYDKEKNEISILSDNYFDANGKNTITDPEELKGFILNIYKTVMLRGIRGTYIYACDPNLREYFSKFIHKFKYEKRIGFVPHDKVTPFINSIPIYDLSKLELTFNSSNKVSEFQWIELPSTYKYSEDLFACTMPNESMNNVIPNSSICLFREYKGSSLNGKIVLSKFIMTEGNQNVNSISEYNLRTNTSEHHKTIVLKPLTNNEEFNEIVIPKDEESNLIVLGLFECVL